MGLLQGLVTGGPGAEIGGPLLSVVPGVGGLLGGLMGLFGGGPSQSQKQEQTQNQNQNQSQQATANASASSSAYNNLTINYPNESAGMALQGLLGAAGAPFNPIGSPGVEQEGAGFAPQAGYQAPGLVNVQAIPAYNPAGSAFVNTPQAGGAGAAPAMVPPNAPPPMQPQAFSAGPSGGAFSPQAAAGALQAAQQFAPVSGSSMVGQAPQQLIANAPANTGAAFGYAPNPYAPPPTVTDATNAQAIGGGMPPTAPQRAAAAAPAAQMPDTQSLLPEMEGLKATEAPSPFATTKPRKNETVVEANQPVKKDDGELYQIPAKLPESLKAELRAEYNALKDLPEQLQNQIIPGTNMTRAQYQADLTQQIKDADDSLREVSDLVRMNSQLSKRAVQRQLERDAAAQAADDAMAPDSRGRTLAGRAAGFIDETDRLSMESLRGKLQGRSLQYSSSPSHAQDILENKKFFYRVGNLLNPRRVANAQAFVNNSHADFVKRVQAATPDLLRQEEAVDKEHEQARDFLMKNLAQQVIVAKQQQVTAARALNRDRILEANLLQMRRQDIFKNIKNTIDQTNTIDRQQDLNAYRTVNNNLAQLEFNFKQKMQERNAQDREAQIQINFANQQLAEEMAPSIIQRNMMMGQGLAGQMEGAPPVQQFFTPQMAQAQQERKATLQGGLRKAGLVPPPPPLTPGVGDNVGGGLMPTPGMPRAAYFQQLKTLIDGHAISEAMARDLYTGAVNRGEVK